MTTEEGEFNRKVYRRLYRTWKIEIYSENDRMMER